MPLLVGVDGVHAVVISVALPFGGAVSLQKPTTVVFPCRLEREELWI